MSEARAEKAMNQEVATFSEGVATLWWPSEMSAEEYEDFKAWIALIIRKAERASRATETPAPHEQR